MWSDALSWQSHGPSVLTPKCTHKDFPRKGLSACRPFAGKESTEATREFLEEVDAAILDRVEIKPVKDVAEVIRTALVCEPPMVAESQLESPLPVPQKNKVNAYRGS